MRDTYSNNRVVFGVSRSNTKGWCVWNSTSVNWGTWSTHRVSEYYTNRAEAVREARRQAKDPAFRDWFVKFDFEDESPLGLSVNY